MFPLSKNARRESRLPKESMDFLLCLPRSNYFSRQKERKEREKSKKTSDTIQSFTSGQTCKVLLEGLIGLYQSSQAGQALYSFSAFSPRDLTFLFQWHLYLRAKITET